MNMDNSKNITSYSKSNTENTSYINNTINEKDNNNATTSEWSEFCDESVLQMLDEPFEMMLNGSRLRTDEKYCGFDNNTGDSWIYPTNLPIRNYQFNIARVALFRNTLVVLPTGLGKTFIAAVVMYNIYRWYPTGKVIFMAPTRPLVNQQIDACRKIMGIPMSDTAEMTGKQNKKLRHELWNTKRIFFATPQVVQSDINDNEQDFPFNDIKLLVIDEAHKAKGRYAYTEVVQSIMNRNRFFRILALSATPGRRIEDVVEIIQNLFISHIELRWENSVDVIPYTHKKNVKTIVVPLGEELTKIKNEFIDIIDPYVRSLIDNGVLSGSISNLSRGWLIMEQKRYKEMSIRHRHPNHSTVSTDFSVCISLYHALELLERHGIRVFLNFFEDQTENQNGEKYDKFFVSMNPTLKKFIEKLRQKAGPNPFLVSDQTMTNGEIAKVPDDLDFGHPKYEMAKKFLIEHFEKENNSRAIIFCEYRESVLLIHRLLLQCRPLIRPRIFVGQGGAGSIRAVTQKQQIQIMLDFRNGTSNTLIATSVAEEGIDVGDVDLIICFDINTKNPTRFVQRIGRTGRKRQGHVIMLVTEGKEHSMVKEVLATKDKTNQKIAKSKEIQQILYKNSPRIVPPEFDPKCVQTYIRIPREEQKENEEEKTAGSTKKSKARTKKRSLDVECDETISETNKKSKKGPKKKFTKSNGSNADMRNFLKKIELDNEEKEIFNVPSKKSKTASISNNSINNNSSVVSDNVIDDYFDDANETMENENVVLRKKTCQNIMRKLNNFARRLDNDSIEGDIIKTPIDALKSKVLSKRAKRFYLEQNVTYLKEKYEAIKALEAVTDMTDDDISNEIKNLKEEFVLIENVFDGRSEMIRFLNEYDEYNLNMMNENKNLDRINNKFEKLFEGLEKRDLFDNIENYINEKLKEFELNNVECNDLGTIENESIVYNNDTNLNESSHITGYNFDNKEELFDSINEHDDIIDSKYASQWTKFKTNEIKMQSTPLRNELNSRRNFSIKNSTTTTLSNILTHNLDQDDKCNAGNDCINDDEFRDNRIIESDLFDDDFNEMLAKSSDLIIEAENEIKTKIAHEKEQEHKLVENNRNEQICNEKSNKEDDKEEEEEEEEENRDMEDTGIEDFDINDFFEPFDEEEEEQIGEIFCMKQFNPIVEIPNKDINVIDKKNENIHETVDEKSIIKYSSVDKNENIQMKITEQISDGNKLQMKNKNENLSPSTSLLSKEKESSKSIIETSPSVFKRKINFLKLKSFHSETSVSTNAIKNDDNTLRKFNQLQICTNPNIKQNEIDESVIGKAMYQRNKRQIESSNESSSEIENEFVENSPKRIRKRIKRRRCSFFDEEAKCSDADDDNDENTYSNYVMDSIVVDDNDELQPLTINMRAKYLQSIRSPTNNVGAFKIPSVRHNYPPLSQIYSQPITKEDIALDTYKEDSFVISDDENIPDNEIQNEICPLERAEAILKAKRKAKRERILNRRKRIIKCTESSDDDNGDDDNDDDGFNDKRS